MLGDEVAVAEAREPRARGERTRFLRLHRRLDGDLEPRVRRRDPEHVDARSPIVDVGEDARGRGGRDAIREQLLARIGQRAGAQHVVRFADGLGVREAGQILDLETHDGPRVRGLLRPLDRSQGVELVLRSALEEVGAHRVGDLPDAFLQLVEEALQAVVHELGDVEVLERRTHAAE